MKNKGIKITTKVATAMALASVIVSTASIAVHAAEFNCDVADDSKYETPVVGEVVPEAQMIIEESSSLVPAAELRTDSEPEDTEIRGQEVAPAVLRTELELEYTAPGEMTNGDPVINGMVVAPPIFRPEPESEYAAMIEKENMKDDSVIRGEAVSQALVRTSDGEFVVPITPESTPEVVEKPAEEEYIRNKKIRYATHKPVNQYDIKPGKYYDLFESNLVDKDRLRVIYVKRVYEDPRWIGSERMVEFIDCETGKTETIQVNRFFGGNYFYEEIKKDDAPSDDSEVKKSEDVSVTEPRVKKTEQVAGRKVMTTDDIPHYGKIKQRYFEKGSNAAFMLFLYYHPTPFGYEVVEHIEKEIAAGNRGYEINGVYYDSPESDPYFNNKRILYK